MMHDLRIGAMCVLIAAILCMGGGDFSSPSYAESPAAYLSIPLHAQAAALSGAVGAWRDHYAGAQYNPALLDAAQEYGITASYTVMSLDRMYAAVTPVAPIGRFIVAGLSITNFGIRGFEARDDIGVRTGTFEDRENSITAAAAGRVLFGISWGAAGRYLYQRLADGSANGMGFDLGATWQPIKQLCVGVAARNLGSLLWWSTGTHEMVVPAFRLGANGTFLDTSLIVECDVEKSTVDPVDLCAGAQYTVLRAISLRVGAATSVDYQDMRYRPFDLSFGAGFRYSMVAADYALLWPSSDLGLQHKISITLSIKDLF
jgi:hypothetical protein